VTFLSDKNGSINACLIPSFHKKNNNIKNIKNNIAQINIDIIINDNNLKKFIILFFI